MIEAIYVDWICCERDTARGGATLIYGFIRGLVSVCLEGSNARLADSPGVKKENIKDLKDKAARARMNDGPKISLSFS